MITYISTFSFIIIYYMKLTIWLLYL